MRRMLYSRRSALALLVGTAAYAHHSYAATYDITQRRSSSKGKLVQFVYSQSAFLRARRGSGRQGDDAAVGGGVERHRPAGQSGRDAGVAQGRRSGRDRRAVRRACTGEFRALMVNLKRPADGFTWGGAPAKSSTRSTRIVPRLRRDDASACQHGRGAS